MEFISAIRDLGVSKKAGQNDDLFVDRLNHKYTVAILVMFAIVVTASQYGGSPINCWLVPYYYFNQLDFRFFPLTFNKKIDKSSEKPFFIST